MPDPQTPNLGLYVPLNSADVGTWDVPMNANFNLLDSLLGGSNSIVLSNVPITLSAAQYNNSVIVFTGTLTADVVVTFPAVGRVYTIFNNCAANTTFKVTALINPANNYVALPPNEIMTIAADGINMAFVGLDHVGTYWDFGGSAVPNWVTGSNPQPYLNCDGTAFSSAVYPALRDYLGAATLPDARGRFRAALNQGTTRCTGSSATGGLNANTLSVGSSVGGGSQTFIEANLPTISPGTHVHPITPMGVNSVNIGDGTFGSNQVYVPGGSINTSAAVGTVGLGTNTPHVPPSYVGGLTLIRAG